jgi:hypothetical protein
MSKVYVLSKVDHKDHNIVGVFEARGLAEMARDDLRANLTDSEYDQGVLYFIAAFELGEVYQ